MSILREWIGTTQSWATGESDEHTETIANIFNTSGMIALIVFVASNATNAITFTLDILDSAANVDFTKATIAENATTVLNGDSTPSAEVSIENDGVVHITPSGDPGASGVTVTVYIYYVSLEAEIDGRVPRLSNDGQGVGIQGALCPISTARMGFSDTSVQSLPFAEEVRVVRLLATQDCHIAFIGSGDINHSSTTYDMLIKANLAEYFSIRPGTKYLAVIRSSTNGNLYITSMG